MVPFNSSILKYNARLLRNNMTEAEKRLWFRLRRKQIAGLQFYRQKPLLNYIVDFYCPKAKLVIEVDGGQHFESEHMINDKQRDKVLTELGLSVMRFDNSQVLNQTDSVIDDIYRFVTKT